MRELPIVGEVRGKGLLIGIEFVADKLTRATFDPKQGVTSMVVDRAFERGVAGNARSSGSGGGSQGGPHRHKPPFTVSEGEVNQVADVLRESISQVVKDLGF